MLAVQQRGCNLLQKMKKKFTSISETARLVLQITRDEYALCQYIQYRSADPRQKERGRCCDKKEDIAAFIGITRRGLHKMICRLESEFLVFVGSNGGSLSVTAKWIDTENEQREREQSSDSIENKVHTTWEQSSHDMGTKFTRHGNKVPAHIKEEYDNKIDKREEEKPSVISQAPAPSQAENFFPSEQKENLKVPGGGGAAAGANYIVTTTDADALPGSLVRVAEHVVFPGSPSTLMSATYRTDLPQRAADGDEAEAIITAWTALNIETVKFKYERAKRSFASADLEKLIVKFCGQYSSHADSGTMQRFLTDPATFFNNKLSSWLIDQPRFEKMAEPRVPAGMQPTEQRYTAPKSAEKVPAYTP